MICYKDRAYCSKSLARECKDEDCSRTLTDEDRRKAEELKLFFSIADFYRECDKWNVK